MELLLKKKGIFKFTLWSVSIDNLLHSSYNERAACRNTVGLFFILYIKKLFFIILNTPIVNTALYFFFRLVPRGFYNTWNHMCVVPSLFMQDPISDNLFLNLPTRLILRWLQFKRHNGLQHTHTRLKNFLHDCYAHFDCYENKNYGPTTTDTIPMIINWKRCVLSNICHV